MEKILLDSLYGEVQNATKGLPLTLRENLCLDAWCFSLNTNRCFVLFCFCTPKKCLGGSRLVVTATKLYQVLPALCAP